MSQCDLCGGNENLTARYTIYSARPAGPDIVTSETSDALPNQVIVTRTKPYKEFVAHHYLICRRCTASTIMKTIVPFQIVLIVSLIAFGVVGALNKSSLKSMTFLQFHFLKSMTFLQFLTILAIFMFVMFCSGLVVYRFDPARRLKRKAIRSRGGRAFEFKAWTEQEFEQVFGKQKPD